MLYCRLVNTERETRAAARNFRLGVLNGLLFTVADRLMDPTLVLAAFVSHLTQSPFWLGLILPITDGGWFLPQFWISGYLQNQRRKITLYRRVARVRASLWLVMVTALCVVRSPAWLLAAFMLTYTLTSLSSGLSGLSFLEVVGKTIPGRRMAEFFARRLAAGGAAAVAATLLVRWLVDDAGPLSFPLNFALLFGIAALFAYGALAAFSQVEEPADEVVQPPASWRMQTRRAWQILRTDLNYRRFLLLRTMLLVAGSAPPFFAVYVERRLGGPVSMVGVYLAVYTTSNLLAHVGLGRLSARLGLRRLIGLATSAGLLMTAAVLALALLAGPLHLSGTAASLWLVPVFVLYGLRESGVGIAGQSLLLDIAPPSERSLYVGFTNTLLGVVLLATGVSGVLVAALGFTALFVVTTAAHGLALLSAWRMREAAAAKDEAGPLYVKDEVEGQRLEVG